MFDSTLSSASYLQRLRQRRKAKTNPSNNMQHQVVAAAQKPNQAQAATATSDNLAARQSSAKQTEPNPYLPKDYRLKESRVVPGMMRPLPEEEVLIWQAPSRPFKKHNKQFFTTIIVIALLVALIFFFAGQGILPVAVAGSVTFLIYVLFSIPPQQTTNKISTYGIRIENVLYYWEELGRFWFDEKYGQKLLQIETVRFPGRIALLLGKQKEENLKAILSEVLLNKKPELTFFEKTSNWLAKKVPLDFD